MNQKCFICLKKNKSAARDKFVCLNCFEISCRDCLQSYGLLNTRFQSATAEMFLAQKFEEPPPTLPKKSGDQLKPPDHQLIKNQLMAEDTQRGQRTRQTLSQTLPLPESTPPDSKKTPLFFYPQIINESLGKNSRFICLNCCLNGIDPGVQVVQRITKLTIIRPKGDHQKQVCSIPLLNKFVDNNPFLNEATANITYKVDQKYIDRLSKEKDLQKEHFLRRFFKHYMKYFKTHVDSKPEEPTFRKSDFIEFRCLKLDQRGRHILSEMTYPDKGTLYIRDKAQPISEFEPLKLNSSLKKRKDCTSRSKLHYFCRQMSKVFEGDVQRGESLRLDFDNVFDNKNSVAKHKRGIAYVMIGLVTREVGFLDLLRRELLRYLVSELMAYFCSFNHFLWEILVFHFESWVEYFLFNLELNLLLRAKFLDLEKAGRVLQNHLQHFFGKWSRQLLAHPANSGFADSFGEIKKVIDQFQLHQPFDTGAWRVDCGPRQFNLKSKFKDTKYSCKKSKVFPRRVNFLSFLESFAYIKSLFSEASGKEASQEVQLDSVKLDLVCKMTFTALEYPCRGNNCLHLACFSLKSFLSTSKFQDYKKTYCPFCKEPIQTFYYDTLIDKILEINRQNKDSAEHMYFDSIENFAEFISKIRDQKIPTLQKNQKFPSKKTPEIIRSLEASNTKPKKQGIRDLVQTTKFLLYLRFLQNNLYSEYNVNLDKARQTGEINALIDRAAQDPKKGLHNFLNKDILSKNPISEKNKHDVLNQLIDVMTKRQMANKIVLNEREIEYFANIVDVPFFLSIQEDIISENYDNCLGNHECQKESEGDPLITESKQSKPLGDANSDQISKHPLLVENELKMNKKMSTSPNIIEFTDSDGEDESQNMNQKKRTNLVETDLDHRGKKGRVNQSTEVGVEHSMEHPKGKAYQSFGEYSNREVTEIYKELVSFKNKTDFENQKFQMKPNMGNPGKPKKASNGSGLQQMQILEKIVLDKQTDLFQNTSNFQAEGAEIVNSQNTSALVDEIKKSQIKEISPVVDSQIVETEQATSRRNQKSKEKKKSRKKQKSQKKSSRKKPKPPKTPPLPKNLNEIPQVPGSITSVSSQKTPKEISQILLQSQLTNTLQENSQKEGNPQKKNQNQIDSEGPLDRQGTSQKNSVVQFNMPQSQPSFFYSQNTRDKNDAKKSEDQHIDAPQNANFEHPRSNKNSQNSKSFHRPATQTLIDLRLHKKRKSFQLLSRQMVLSREVLDEILDSLLNKKNIFELDHLLTFHIAYFSFKSEGITKRLLCFSEFRKENFGLLRYLFNYFSSRPQPFVAHPDEPLTDENCGNLYSVVQCFNQAETENAVLFIFFESLNALVDRFLLNYPNQEMVQISSKSNSAVKLNYFFRILRNNGTWKKSRRNILPEEFRVGEAGIRTCCSKFVSFLSRRHRVDFASLMALGRLQQKNNLYHIANLLINSKEKIKLMLSKGNQEFSEHLLLNLFKENRRAILNAFQQISGLKDLEKQPQNVYFDFEILLDFNVLDVVDMSDFEEKVRQISFAHDLDLGDSANVSDQLFDLYISNQFGKMGKIEQRILDYDFLFDLIEGRKMQMF